MSRIALFLLLALPLFAQETPHRVVTRTRTVVLFSDLEQQLLNAKLKHDKAALTKLLADDFEVRRSSAPASPVPREEWLESETPEFPVSEFHLSDMAVHLYNENTAVASFIHRAGTGRFFVVDVWNKDRAAWKLAVRYTAPAGPMASAADRKPDGKQ